LARAPGDDVVNVVRVTEADGWRIELLDVGSATLDAADLGGSTTASVECPINVLLLRRPGRTVLVDAGSGPLVNAWPGMVDYLSDVLDVEPDLLIATHLDFDHCGGFVSGVWPDELTPRFSGRQVLVAAEAVESTRSLREAEYSSWPVIDALGSAGLLSEYADGDEPAPGLRLRSAPGHQPGHSMLEVGHSFVFAADVFHHQLHVEHPEWDGQYDADRPLGLQTRHALLREFAERGTTLMMSHIDHAGRIVVAGDGYRWRSL
jgi:glyoxylase-like metal-dependent hydrolase (beta-lactamase superfamily II)